MRSLPPPPPHRLLLPVAGRTLRFLGAAFGLQNAGCGAARLGEAEVAVVGAVVEGRPAAPRDRM